jgi:Fe2+ transport system protein FeoA
MTLADLPTGRTASISNVYIERLISHGITPGSVVTVLRRTKNCMHIKINMTEWAIRNSTAESVTIMELDK